MLYENNNASLIEATTTSQQQAQHQQQAKQHKRQQRTRVMARAWRYSRKASEQFGGSPKDYFSASLKESWKQESEWQKHSYTTHTPDQPVEREHCRISNDRYGITFTVGYSFHSDTDYIQFSIPFGSSKNDLENLIKSHDGNRRHIAIAETALYEWSNLA